MFKDCILIIWAPDATKLKTLPPDSFEATRHVKYAAFYSSGECQRAIEKVDYKVSDVLRVADTFGGNILSLNVMSSEIGRLAPLKTLREHADAFDIVIDEIGALFLCLLNSEDTRYVDTL